MRHLPLDRLHKPALNHRPPSRAGIAPGGRYPSAQENSPDAPSAFSFPHAAVPASHENAPEATDRFLRNEPIYVALSRNCVDRRMTGRRTRPACRAALRGPTPTPHPHGHTGRNRAAAPGISPPHSRYKPIYQSHSRPITTPRKPIFPHLSPFSCPAGEQLGMKVHLLTATPLRVRHASPALRGKGRGSGYAMNKNPSFLPRTVTVEALVALNE